MRQLRFATLFLVLLLASASLFAGGNAEAVDEGPVTITFAITGAGVWEEPMGEIVDAYNASRDDITVEVEYYAHSDYFPTINLRLGSESDDYDIIGVDVPFVAPYVYQEWLQPLDDYFTEAEINEYVPSAREAGSWDGQFYAPPLQTSLVLLWYNTGLLQEAGLEMPEMGVENRITWEELAEIAREGVNRLDPDGSRGISGIDFEQVSRIYQIGTLVNNLGSPVLGEDGLTADGVVNGPEWTRAMEFYQTLFESGISRRGTTPVQNQDQFVAGNTFFYVANGRLRNAAIAKGMVMENLAAAPHPVFEGYEDSAAAGTGSWHVGVSAFSRYPEAAADFVKYLTQGPGHPMWIESSGASPATRTGLERMTNEADVMPFREIIAYDLANVAYPRAITPAYSEFQTIIEATMEDIRNGAVVAEALDSAVDQLEDQIAKYR